MYVTWYKTAHPYIKSPGGIFHLHISQLLVKTVIFFKYCKYFIRVVHLAVSYKLKLKQLGSDLIQCYLV